MIIQTKAQTGVALNLLTHSGVNVSLNGTFTILSNVVQIVECM